MQIRGGRGVFGREQELALAPMDRAGVFTAYQLGEWGYYFHNLSHKESWRRDVYGAEFEAFKHLMKPAGLAGYDRRPGSRRECFEVLREYFLSRTRDLLGRVISVTGHSHCEAYAGEWGARCIGLELGENIAFTQSKIAFARGASRQWDKPWSVQVSPWFGPSCTTSGPLRTEGGIVRGLDAGHSLSFHERMWLHGWFAGPAMMTPENSVAIFFEKPEAPWELTEHGRKAAEMFQFMRKHPRAVPYSPVAVDFDPGFLGELEKSLRRGSRVLMAPRHRKALGAQFDRVAGQGRVEVLESWVNPDTGRPAAISNKRLRELAADLLPLTVGGDPVQYAVNRTPGGWVVELINNRGVIKRGDRPAVVDPNGLARVVLHPRIPVREARFWRSGRVETRPGRLDLELGPGAVEFVELLEPLRP